jgi:hypothetical protein
VRVIAIDRDRDVSAARAAHIDHQALSVLQELGCLMT